MERPNSESGAAPRTGPETGSDSAGGGQLPSAGLGPRVTAVFTAAEQAADHIMKMAREEATDLRSRVEADLEAFRRQQRADAEAEARAILTAAREEAESIRREATMTAAAIEEAARTREQWMNEGIRLVLDRAEWGRRGLDEVLSRLQPFVDREPQEWAEIPAEPLPSLAEAAPAGVATNGDRAPVPPATAEPPVDEPPSDEPAADDAREPDDWRPWRQPTAG